MIEIIPAILPEDFDELQGKLSLVKSLVKTVQVDICDGRFTSKETWPYRYGVIADQSFLKVVGEEDGLPFWQDLDFEIDLMVSRPEEVLPQWIAAGASRVIVHIETVSDFSSIKKITSGLLDLGVALNVDTDSKVLDPIIADIAFVQCMGIAKIGFQGQLFDPRVLEKIASLRKNHPGLVISVDGGVNLETAPALVRAGATRLVAGSAIFESGNIRETIKLLQKF